MPRSAPVTVASRDEAEAAIRAVSLKCRGPLAASIDVDTFDDLPREVQQALADLDPAHLGEKQPRELIAMLLGAEKRQEAHLLDEALRQGCGADFCDVVVAGPWDGRIRPYACPKCNVTGEYRAPHFVVDAEPHGTIVVEI